MSLNQNLELQGDGLVENLYHFLWAKDQLFHTSPQVYIPDTILYKFEQPAFWYFNSKKDGTVLRKNKNNLNNKEIEKVFLKDVSSNGIVAVYIYNKIEKNTVNLMNKEQKLLSEAYQQEEIEQDDEMGNINYNSLSIHDKKENHDKKYLKKIIKLSLNILIKRAFVRSIFRNDQLQDKPYDGVLQKFIDPVGNYNQVLRIIWSPKICVFERKENLKEISDQRFDIYERVVTYEGEEFHSRIFPLRGANLPQRLQTIANSISQHIQNVTFEKMRPNRMILNMKIDRNDKIWFLWCSSLRNEGKKIKLKSTKQYEFIPLNQRLNAQPLKIEDKPLVKQFCYIKNCIQLPEMIRISQSHSTRAPQNLHRTNKCLSCNFLMEPNRMYELTMKMIIQDHELKAFKDQKYMVNKEVQNPKDLIERQEQLTKGLEIKQPHQNYMTSTLFFNKSPIQQELKMNDYSQVKSKINFGRSQSVQQQRSTFNTLIQENQNSRDQMNIHQNLKDKLKIFCIPFIIKQLYPDMTTQQYETLKNDIKFLNQTTYICEECYLCISISSEMSGVKLKIPKLTKIQICKQLNPKKIIKRRNITLLNLQQNKSQDHVDSKYRSQSQENNNNKSRLIEFNQKSAYFQQNESLVKNLTITTVLQPIKDLKIQEKSKKQKPPLPKPKIEISNTLKENDQIQRKNQDLNRKILKDRLSLSVSQKETQNNSAVSTSVHTPQYQQSYLKVIHKIYSPIAKKSYINISKS